MASEPIVSIEEVYEYYKKNGIKDFPKTSNGYPNMKYKKNRDIKEMLIKMKIKSEEKLNKQQENIRTFVSGNKQECMICYEKIGNAAFLECGHTFCLSCIVKHCRENNNCPCCRYEFTTKPKKIEKIPSDTLAQILYNNINTAIPNRGLNFSNEQLPMRGNEIHRTPTSLETFVSQCVTEAMYIQANNPLSTDESIEMIRELETTIINEIVHVSLDVGNSIIQWYDV